MTRITRINTDKKNHDEPIKIESFVNLFHQFNVKAWEDQNSNTYGTKDDPDMDYHYTIKNAITETSRVIIPGSAKKVVENEIFTSFHADWDPDPSIDCPRIVWTEKDSIFKVKAARVTFDQEGHPDGIISDYTISDNTSNNAENPVIVMNRSNATGDVYEAFSSYTCDDDAKRVELDVVNGVDYWEDPVTVDSDTQSIEGEMYITYNSLGNSSYIMREGGSNGSIYTDYRLLDNEPNSLAAVKLCTSRKDDRNIYCAYKQHEDYEMAIIRHLEP